MKSFLSVCAILAILLGAYYVFIEPNFKQEAPIPPAQPDFAHDTDLYPMYNRLDEDEQIAYVRLVTAFENFDESTAEIYQCNSQQEAEHFGERIQALYREIVFEQSEIFWVDPYISEMVVRQYGDTYRVYIQPSYLVSEDDAQSMQEELDDELDKIVKKAKKQDSTFEQILYVYDYILDNCEYDYDLANSDDFDTHSISAYGCLVEGKTICSGYTLAFDAIMKRLGYKCGAEFNSYTNFSIFTGHVWNYCKIDGDYYYFDLTWDDTGTDTASAEKAFGKTHTYFAVTKEELAQSNYTQSKDAPTPLCDGTEYNYFIYNDYNVSSYSFEAVEDILLQQEDEEILAIRFDEYGDLLRAESELLKDGKLYELFPEATGASYIIANSGMHLYIRLQY